MNSIKILGLLINAKGCNAEALKKLGAQAHNILRLLGRVTSRMGGLKEDSLLRVFQAFFISQVTYTAPFLKWSKAERNKLDTLIRSGIKRLLGIAQCASTEKLLELGVNNAIYQLIEAHLTAKMISRLLLTMPGNKILNEAGISSIQPPLDRYPLSKEAKEGITVDPVPRNIHPVYNEGRRIARAKAILKRVNPYGADALFVDAAKCGSENRFAISVVDARGTLISAASVCTKHANEAEQTAIAVALNAAKGPTTVFSDLRTAARAFSSALLSKHTASLVNKSLQNTAHNETEGHHITWFPAHVKGVVNQAGCNPNEHLIA